MPVEIETIPVENETMPIENEFVLDVLCYSDWNGGANPPSCFTFCIP